MDISEEPFHVIIYRKNAAPQKLAARFVPACAVEMHLDISQEQVYARIYCKKNAKQMTYRDLPLALTPTPGVDTLFGEKIRARELRGTCSSLYFCSCEGMLQTPCPGQE